MKNHSQSKCTSHFVPALHYCVLFYSMFNLSLTLYQNVVIRLHDEQQYFVYDNVNLLIIAIGHGTH